MSGLDQRILETGRRFVAEIQREQPSLFNKGRWTGKVMDWAMHHEQFKVQLLRFVDVFPALRTSESLARHLEEYFGGEQDLPAAMKLGAVGAKFGGRLGAAVLSRAIDANIREMARQFIIGESTLEAIRNAGRLRADGFAFVIDLLGEAAVSEVEAVRFQEIYLELLGELTKTAPGWPALGPGSTGVSPRPELDWGFAPRIQISIKPSALYSRIRPVDFEGSVSGVLDRLIPIYRRVIEVGGALALDMESHQHKDITLEVFRRLRGHPEFRHWPHLCLVLQAYLKETDRDVDALLAWSRAEKLPVEIRLVKGAYWDYETVIAQQNGWPIPVYSNKWESDAAFERLARRILENHDLAFLACASHNVRSISAVLETAGELGVPASRYEFQVLYGMAEPVRRALRNLTGHVRLYCPYGQLVPGMAYLVRRLLENTANESFLRQTFVEGEALEQLMANPLQGRTDSQPVSFEGRGSTTSALAGAGGDRLETCPTFTNQPAADFTQARERAAFPEAIAEIRHKHLGRTYALHIGGKEVVTEDRLPSRNPNQSSEVLGHVCQAGVAETEQAMAVAEAAFASWRNTAPVERAAFLFKAAEVMRRRLHEFAAWQVLEVGKQWGQAHADVAEAIDFLEYYGREMIRLGNPRRMGAVPGEDNRLFHEPRGVAAVIAPWNFPLAISTGMVSAAVVTGNCVVYKPSGLSSIIGHQLVEVFREVGLPPGVFNYLPGRSRVMGDFLVEHPAVNLIAFTGSLEVGQRIYQKAAVVQPGQRYLKRVICELGGKNAIIIDDDADLDEAVPHVLASAFGFQGQKCSACSRVIVLDAVYDRFVERLIAAARSWRIGPSEDPANDMGAVIDERALENVLRYAAIAKGEGTLLFESVLEVDPFAGDAGAASPSPRPSPLGRGGMDDGARGTSTSDMVRAFARFVGQAAETEPTQRAGEDSRSRLAQDADDNSSLSPRERAGVRGNSPSAEQGSLHPASSTLPGASLSRGWFAPITIVGDIRPEHRIAQEEVFGPVLAVMRARDFDEAIAWANSTRFALTGAVFSRSPRHLERARREFRVGNLYLNRGSTGALVERQPFGGARMSGVGSKAGGPDYLLQFMDPRVITENTMRRGFVAEEKKG